MRNPKECITPKNVPSKAKKWKRLHGKNRKERRAKQRAKDGSKTYGEYQRMERAKLAATELVKFMAFGNKVAEKKRARREKQRAKKLLSRIQNSNSATMEVETRPPLVDGQLGLPSPSSCGDDLDLRLTEGDLLLDDDERELLKSPTNEDLLLMNDLVDNVGHKGNDDGTMVNGEVDRSNGEVVSEPVANPGDVFRTEVVQRSGRDPSISASDESAKATESSTLSDSTGNPSNLGNIEMEESVSNGDAQYDEVHASSLVIEDPNSIEDLQDRLSGECDTRDSLIQDFTTESQDNSSLPKASRGSQDDVSVQDNSAVSVEKEKNVPKSDASRSSACNEGDSSTVHNEEKTEVNEANVPDANTVGDKGFSEITESILPTIEATSDDDMENDDSNGEDENDVTRDVLPVDITESTVEESSDCNKTGNKPDDQVKAVDQEAIFANRPSLKRRASSEQVETSNSNVSKKSRRNSADCNKITVDVSRSFESFKKLKKKMKDIAEHGGTYVDEDSSLEGTTKDSAAKKLNSKASSSGSTPQTNHDKNSIMILDSDDEDGEVNISRDGVDSEKENCVDSDKLPTGPRCALDKLFDGRKEITLNRKTLTKIIKSYVSQYLMTYGEFGKATALALKAETMMSKLQTAAANFEKQKEESRLVMKKLLEDRKANKKWDETLVPQRMTRSVGLQVCTVGTYNVKIPDDRSDKFSNKKGVRGGPYEYSTAVSMQADAFEQQKKTLVEQQKSIHQTRKTINNQQSGVGNPVMSRPTAKKSVTSLPNSRLMQQRKSVVNNEPPQFQKIAPRLNGIQGKSMSPVPAQNVNKLQTLPSTLRSALQIASTSNVTNASAVVGALQRSGSQKTMSPPTKVLQIPSQLIATNKPVVNSTSLGTVSVQQQANKSFVSGPGRPAVSVATPPTIVNALASTLTTSSSNQGLVIQMNSQAVVPEKVQPKKAAGPPALDATIDLTDLDDDVPVSSRTAANHVGGAPGKQLSPLKPVMKSSVGGTPQASKVMRYPPLPNNPPNFNPATAPPKPHLGICDTAGTVTQGIMLTWHFSNVQPVRKIVKFQVYAYQESKGDGEEAWKKVGDVGALPLPMACTLTQFREGYTYHFIVRAIDECGDPGPFSSPSTITLVKKI